MNTIVLKDMLSSRVIGSLRNPTRAKAYCNHEVDFAKGQGDTIAFQIFPEMEAQVGGVAGSEQDTRDFIIDETNLVVNKRIHDAFRITNWEKFLTNFDQQSKLVAMTRRAWDRKCEDYIFNQMVNDAGTSINSSASPATESASTIYSTILQFKEIIDDKGSNTDWVEGAIVVFINDATHKILKLSNIYDNNEAGLRARQMGAVGSLLDGNIHCVLTSRMSKVDSDDDGTADYSYILGMRSGSVAFAQGKYELKITDAEKAFAKNVLYEGMIGVDTLGTPNSDLIVKKHITNMTSTTPFEPTLQA